MKKVRYYNMDVTLFALIPDSLKTLGYLMGIEMKKRQYKKMITKIYAKGEI